MCVATSQENRIYSKSSREFELSQIFIGFSTIKHMMCTPRYLGLPWSTKRLEDNTRSNERIHTIFVLMKDNAVLEERRDRRKLIRFCIVHWRSERRVLVEIRISGEGAGKAQHIRTSSAARTNIINDLQRPRKSSERGPLALHFGTRFTVNTP